MAYDLRSYITKRYGDLTTHCLGCGDNLRHANIRPGDTVLDLGCGSGKTLLEVLNLDGFHGYVVGIDLTPHMIKAAQERLCNYKNISLINSSFEQILLDNNSVDVVLSNCAINHAPDKQKVFMEIHRVLKKGGKFVISDIATRYPLPESIKADPVQWANCFGGAITETEYIDMLNKIFSNHITIHTRREYIKSGYDFVSLTVSGEKLIL